LGRQAGHADCLIAQTDVDGEVDWIRDHRTGGDSVRLVERINIRQGLQVGGAGVAGMELRVNSLQLPH
jgi:hypothetical protein